jgi:hypothetical protein
LICAFREVLVVTGARAVRCGAGDAADERGCRPLLDADGSPRGFAYRLDEVAWVSSDGALADRKTSHTPSLGSNARPKGCFLWRQFTAITLAIPRYKNGMFAS